MEEKAEPLNYNHPLYGHCNGTFILQLGDSKLLSE